MKKLFGNDKVDIKNVNEVLDLSKKLLKVLLILLVIVGVYSITLIFKLWNIFGFIFLILKVLSPFFIGLVVAWLFDPVVKFLHKKGVNRIIGTSIVYIVMLGAIYFCVMGLFPVLLNQMNEFINTLPKAFNDVTSWANNFVDRFKNISFIDVGVIKKDILDSVSNFVLSLTTDIPVQVVSFVRGIFSTIGLFAVGLMIGFYLLFDFDNVGKVLLSLLPKNMRKDALDLFKEANSSLFGYVKGTLISSLLIFVLSSIIFAIFGLKAPLLLGLICGITNIIPYVGPYMGAIPAVIVGFTQGLPVGIATTISIVVVQFVEGNFIHPWIISKTMNIHPVTVLISLLIFGHFFGILGMIIAAPVVAIIKVFAVFIENKYDILSYSKEK